MGFNLVASTVLAFHANSCGTVHSTLRWQKCVQRIEIPHALQASGGAFRLYKKYSKQYGQQAAALASAVTNELFGAPPANEAGRAGYDLEVL